MALTRITRARIGVAAGLVALAAAVIPGQLATADDTPAKPTVEPKPAIVLVHGAWADASSWNEVTRRLQRVGYTVLAPPNPLRGLSSDAAYVSAYLQQATSGPVVLVGHSYGGAVITNAAPSDPDVKALVYINAFAPDQGETVFQLVAAQPGSALGGDPTQVFNFVQYPGAPAGDLDVYLKTDVFINDFANDLPPKTAAVLAAGQRPATLSSGTEPSGVPAWKTLPSWYLVGTLDKIIPPAQQRIMAERAGSTTTEIRAGHVSMLSKPAAVTAVIENAARSVQ